MPTGIVVVAVVGIIIIGVLLVVELFVVTALLLSLLKLVQQLHEQVDPLIAKAESLLATANAMAEKVQGKTEQIADRAAQTNDLLGFGMEHASRLVQRTIAGPLIRGVSLLAGLRAGLASWRRQREKRQETGQS